MKKRFRIWLLLLMFALCMSQGAQTVYAETTSGEEVAAEETASSDASLSSLRIAQASLVPEFDPEQLTYTASVPYEVTRIALTAQTASPEARKIINGTSDLKVGENVVKIEVTAEDGTVREYRIILTRQESAGTDISESDESIMTDTSGESLEESQIPETTLQESEETMTDASEGQGGFQTAAPSEEELQGSDLLSFLLEHHRLILVGLCAVCLVLLLVILVVLIVRRKNWEDEGDEEVEDDEEDKDHSEQATAAAEVKKETAEDPVEEILDDILDFDDLDQDEPNTDTMEELSDKEESFNDLDDDFEMLLEDDDDFDFLDF